MVSDPLDSGSWTKDTYPFEDQCQYIMIDISTAWVIFQDYGEVFKGGFGGQLKAIVLLTCQHLHRRERTHETHI
jgi:hypothetical protein